MRFSSLVPWGLGLAGVLVGGLLVWVPEVAHAGHEEDPDAPGVSRSVGWPSRGLLVGGGNVPESEHIRHPADDLTRGFFWGTREVAGLVKRTARTVHQAHPGARLPVGELSRRGGGRIPGHRSHQNGRDVDLGFYLLDGDGDPAEPARFVNVGWHGKGVYEGERVVFDEERNWRMIETLLSQVEVPVQYVFVHGSIRRRLLATARRAEADAEVITRAKRAILPPKGSRHPHRNHFHVRVYCDPGDRPGCRDRGVVWSWVPDAFLGDPRTVRAAH